MSSLPTCPMKSLSISLHYVYGIIDDSREALWQFRFLSITIVHFCQCQARCQQMRNPRHGLGNVPYRTVHFLQPTLDCWYSKEMSITGLNPPPKKKTYVHARHTDANMNIQRLERGISKSAWPWARLCQLLNKLFNYVTMTRSFRIA